MRCTWGVLRPCLARTFAGKCSLLGSVLTMGGKPQVSEKVKGEPQREKEKRGQQDTKKTSKKARARCHLDGQRQRSQPQPRDDATAKSCISAFSCEVARSQMRVLPPALFGQELVPTSVISDGTVMKVPEGAKCDDCGHVHSQGFSWLTRTASRKIYRNDSTFQKAVIEGVQNKNAVGGNFPQQSVGKVFMQFLEIRQPARVLNSEELKKSLGTSRLPKHMKSVLRITVPHTPQPGEDISTNTKDRRQELFAFQDPNWS